MTLPLAWRKKLRGDVEPDDTPKTGRAVNTETLEALAVVSLLVLVGVLAAVLRG